MRKFLIALILIFLMLACQISDLTTNQAPGNINPDIENQAAIQMQAQTEIAKTQIALSALNLAQQNTQVALFQTNEAQSLQNQSLQETQRALEQAYRELGKTQTAMSGTEAAIGTATASYLNSQAVLVQTAFVITTTAQAAGFGTDFTGAYIYAWGQWNENTYAMTIQLTDKVKNEQFFLDIGNETFKCMIVEKYPNRLYCTGKPLPGGSYTVQVYYSISNGTKKVVFTQDYALPRWTPTSLPTLIATITPESTKRPTRTPKP